MTHRVASVVSCAVFSSGALGCSTVVGIEDRSGTWCTLEAEGSQFCEDFDHEPPFEAWTAVGSPATTASERSEPNAMRATVGTALKRSFPDLQQAVTFSLDVRVERAAGAKPEEGSLVYDTALVLVTRHGGTLGLYADPAGSLYFAAATAIPGGTPDVQGSADPPKWRRVHIRYDAGSGGRAATFSVDGAASRMVVEEGEGAADPDTSEATVVTIGALPIVADIKLEVGCSFDNVSVDEVDVSGPPKP